VLGDFCPYDHGIDPVIVEDIGMPNVMPYPSPPGKAGLLDLFMTLSFPTLQKDVACTFPYTCHLMLCFVKL
jgi:hypothetical protein